MKMREGIIRLTQLLLGVDGILHLASFGSAIHEEAVITACIMGVQTVAFFLGVYFIGHDHSHHAHKGE